MRRGVILVCFCTYSDLFLPTGFAQASEFAREYAKSKGPGTRAKPEQHPVFHKLATLMQRTLDKCERENSLM